MSDKYLDYETALKKLQKYCAYQDRCHSEVRSKLIELEVYGDRLEQIIADLISEKFLDEQRFANSFAGGKFRIKKWGRTKIRLELKMRKVSDYCIKKALLQEIPDEDYLDTLAQVLKKKASLTQEPNAFKRNSKIAKYAISKGFESHLVWELLKGNTDFE